MSIKMKSQSLLTVFLVGSLCGLTNYVNASQNDFTEEEGSRLQITGSTNLILAAIDDISDSDAAIQITVDELQDNGVPAGTVIVGADSAFTALTNDLTSISRAIAAMEGTGFVPGTDSLKIISDNQGTQGLGALATAAIQTTQGTTALATLANQTTQGLVALATASAQATQGVGPLATSAQAQLIIDSNGVTAGTALTPGAAYTPDTNDLTSLSLGLSTIEGSATGGGVAFTMTLASLVVIARQTALAQVMAAAGSAVLALPIVGATNAAAFNTAVTNPAAGSVFSRLGVAMTTPTNANIVLLQAAITTAQLVDITTGAITSAYPYPAITADLNSLQRAVTNWLPLTA